MADDKTKTGGAAAKKPTASPPQAAPKDAAVSAEAETQPKETLIDQFYQAVLEAFGGDNSNQYFCLTMPGTVVNKQDYEYDVNQGKPTLVADAESKLVNQLYDPCRITASPNGRHLASQYVTALDVLTMKLNPKIYDVKQLLRDLLNSPYDYVTQEGEVIKGTVQQIFYKLYEEWVDAKREWAKMQVDERRRLFELYPENPKRALNEYDDWYQTMAEGQLAKLESKMGKILAVFSVNDMKLIESILASGAGAELGDARERVEYAKKYSPDGGYVYPVTLNPSDWFNCLDTDFDYVDMLESPEAYAQKINMAKKKHQSLMRKLGAMMDLDETGKYEEKLRACKAAEEAFDTKFGQVDYLKDAIMVAKSLSGLGIGTAVLDGTIDTAKQVSEENPESAGKLTDDLVQSMMGAYDESNKAHMELDSAGQSLVSATMSAMNSKAASLQSAIKNLKSQIDENKEEMDDLIEKMRQSNIAPKDIQAKIAPDAFSKRFTQLNITSTVSESLSETQRESQASEEKVSVNCLFAGYSGENKNASSSLDQFQLDKSTTVEIGMLAMKVNVERNWFEPGVFLLTRDMYNTSGVSASAALDNSLPLEDGLRKLRESNVLFPCFSTGFLLVKDVTVKVAMSESLSQTQKSEISGSSAKSGGCLFFKSHKSESSESSSEQSQTSFNGKEMCVRIPGAQILGQFMEITPPDMSQKLAVDNDAKGDEYSIAEFAEKCREVLQTMRRTNATEG